MLAAKVESILFVLNKPIEIKKIAQLCECGKDEIEVVLETLKNKHNNEQSGINVLTTDKEAQFVSNQKNSKLVETLVKEEIEGELTRPQLEALTVVAYRGPITKLDLERIRGVNCSLILRNLLIKGLIEAENDKVIENTRYRITPSFMRHLGILETRELLNYEEFSRAESLNDILEDKQTNYV